MSNECIICFDLIDVKEQELDLFRDCQHNSYHLVCITNWINKCIDKNINPSCPVCCKELKTIMIINPLNEHIQIEPDENIIYTLDDYPRYCDCSYQCCCICFLSILFSIVIISYFTQ